MKVVFVVIFKGVLHGVYEDVNSAAKMALSLVHDLVNPSDENIELINEISLGTEPRVTLTCGTTSRRESQIVRTFLMQK